MKTECCNYHDMDAIKYNPYNKVVQCHNCGHVYTPKQYDNHDDKEIIRPEVSD